MRRRVSVGIVLVLAVLVGGFAVAFRSDPVQDARGPAPVVFVCRNGVAMSVWSAAYFNRLAAERGLRERAVARASIPSFSNVPWHMRLALVVDGFRLHDFHPQVIDAADARDADLVVVIDDAELPSDALVPDGVRTERWQGFPPMREQYFPSRTALKQHVESLVASIAAREPR